MRTHRITLLVRRDPRGGHVAEAMGHAIVTQAETLPGLRRMVRNAVRCHFGPYRPRIVRLRRVRNRDAVIALED